MGRGKDIVQNVHQIKPQLVRSSLACQVLAFLVAEMSDDGVNDVGFLSSSLS